MSDSTNRQAAIKRLKMEKTPFRVLKLPCVVLTEQQKTIDFTLLIMPRVNINTFDDEA